MIYTSYFAKVKKIPEDACVSIALGGNFWNGTTCYVLTPKSNLLCWWKSLSKEQQNEPKNQAIYEKIYRRDVLRHLDVHDMYRQLNEKILLCFEKSDSFCHRHIVAKWFREAGYDCEELV